MNHAQRIHRLMAEIEIPLLVTSLVNIRYLTGFRGSNGYLYVTADGATFLTDGRYGELVAGLLEGIDGVSLEVYSTGLHDRIVDTFGAAREVRLEQSHISWGSVLALARRFDGELTPSSGVVEGHRVVKDRDEVEALRRAAAAGDAAFARLGRLAAAATTESELSELLIDAMEDAGGARAGWPPIVAVGANASRPHHGTGGDRIHEGLLLVDYGCTVDGYHSDMTRTVVRNVEPGPELSAVYEAVLEANEAGIAAVEPGATAGDVDRAARDMLAAHGYEEYFLHSTGHGVGLEIHEAPSARAGSTEVLEPGQVLTVEPGAYLPGRLGVRIEDMVLVTEHGHEVLTKSDKEMVLT